MESSRALPAVFVDAILAHKEHILKPSSVLRRV